MLVYCGVLEYVRISRALWRGECGAFNYIGVDCGEVFLLELVEYFYS